MVWILFLSMFPLIPAFLGAAVLQGAAARWSGSAKPHVVVLIIYSAAVFLMILIINVYGDEDDYLRAWWVPTISAVAWTAYLWVAAGAAVLAARVLRRQH